MGLNATEIIRRAFLAACREHGVQPWTVLPDLHDAAVDERARSLLAWIGAGDVTVGDLATHLGVKHSTAYALLRDMEKRDLVRMTCRRPFRVTATGRRVEDRLPKPDRRDRIALEVCW